MKKQFPVYLLHEADIDRGRDYIVAINSWLNFTTVTFENVCRNETSGLNQTCASSICLSLLFASYFLSNCDGPRTKVFRIHWFGFFVAARVSL